MRRIEIISLLDLKLIAHSVQCLSCSWSLVLLKSFLPAVATTKTQIEERTRFSAQSHWRSKTVSRREAIETKQ